MADDQGTSSSRQLSADLRQERWLLQGPQQAVIETVASSTAFNEPHPLDWHRKTVRVCIVRRGRALIQRPLEMF